MYVLTITQEVGQTRLRGDWTWNSPRRASTEPCYLADREAAAQSGKGLAQ